MNQEYPRELIISGIHFDLTPSLKTFVQEKAERLFRHHERIIRLRVALDYEQRRPGYAWFTAKGQLASHGRELCASVASPDCHQSLSLLIDKLDRMLRRCAVTAKAKRNHPHLVEFPVALPKAV
ncbi:ribosome hibernation-promoting factor, HPF/YfiA family [Opitutus terrae]|uniref:Sigma 54 modulation protein/ribosomal protein S30EA n=1 Tax=Opitutus terrae (strain DSM 11246 / JCM 15787 / PB90-1) TaxID=452637 RepID=B1ZRM1_OPITP|nr:ribosome-associated translation inhibitor RaiA [Opitutus terrae]ACB77689.1 sigma 54 modulation protein/ribosomal protein S30EA [Opitutus terrae PB90-1]